jgi:hypothetical protein
LPGRSGFLPIGHVQPFADRYGYGNKTRKLFHLSDVVCNLLTADESNVPARLFGCPGSLARPLRRLQGPRNEELEVIEDVIPLFNVNVKVKVPRSVAR